MQDALFNDIILSIFLSFVPREKNPVKVPFGSLFVRPALLL